MFWEFDIIQTKDFHNCLAHFLATTSLVISEILQYTNSRIENLYVLVTTSPVVSEILLFLNNPIENLYLNENTL